MNFKRYHESENLLNFDDLKNAQSGTIYTLGGTGYSVPHLLTLDLKPNTTYTLSSNYVRTSSNLNVVYFQYADIEYAVSSDNSPSFTTGTTGIAKIGFFDTRTGADEFLSGTAVLMLNEGSTPQPYEPYSSEVWHDIPHYIHNTATDTITTLPAIIYADGNSATVGISGNMSQSGTPTPSNPVEVNGVGVRTENLFDGSTSATNQRLSASGTGTYAAQGYSVSRFIEIEPSTYYRIITGETSYYNLYNENKQYIYGSATNAKIPDSYANARYIRFDFKTENIPSVMLVKGSTAPSSYIPYGYKIPISSASTTTPVYLGEVQTTRKILKKVLDGSETTWTSAPVQGRMSFSWKTGSQNPTGTYVLCTHYKSEYTAREGVCFITSNNVSFIDSRFQTLDDFKNFLADEYAAGHPVTVWYVITNPTTGIVNQPLRKIGNYADTVSGITIPTTAGENSFDVLTTLKPSEVMANYHGWHPVQSVHEYDSNYTITTMQALTIAQLQTHTISDLQGGEWS